MAIFKRDMVDINLETGNIHRSFLKHSIGFKDAAADHFGIRVYRDGEAVSLTGVSVQGVFMPPQGEPIAITSGNIVSGNEAEVVLPQACYNYDGQFTLAIKLVDATNAVTGTMRIVDGMVDNTNASGTVAPTEAVPTYQEILAVYDDMVDALADMAGYADNFAPAFDIGKSYVNGSYVMYDGVLYILPDGHDANVTWANTTKKQVNIGEQVFEIETAFNERKATTNTIFNSVFDSNIVFFQDSITFNSEDGGTWKSVAYRFEELTSDDVLYIHCGTVTNGVSDRKLSVIAYDSNDEYIGDGVWIPNSGTDTRYEIPSETSYVVMTLYLSRGTAIGRDVYVTFNDLQITVNSANKEITIKDSSLKPIDITSKEYQYKTQYMDWQPGIYSANDGQVVGEAYYHSVIDVVPGQTYNIDGYSWLAILPCIFVDSQGNTVGKYPTEETSVITRQQFEIEVPESAVKMYCDALLNYYQAGDIGRWDMYACIVKRKILTSEYQIEKPLIVLSDSWSEKNITASSNYVDYLVNDGFDVYNAGVGGTGYRKTYNEGKAWYQRALNLPTDKGNNVLLFGSFNDMSVDNYELGDIDSTDISTICGCINQTITNIYSRIPLANIMIASPGTWRWWNNIEVQSDAQKAQAYCNALKSICEKRHIPFYDYYESCGLRPWDEDFANAYYKEGFASNTTHPNDAGQYYYVYPKLRDFLIRNSI